jgi:hypothetical protein
MPMISILRVVRCLLTDFRGTVGEPDGMILELV